MGDDHAQSEPSAAVPDAASTEKPASSPAASPASKANAPPAAPAPVPAQKEQQPTEAKMEPKENKEVPPPSEEVVVRQPNASQATTAAAGKPEQPLATLSLALSGVAPSPKGAVPTALALGAKEEPRAEERAKPATTPDEPDASDHTKAATPSVPENPASADAAPSEHPQSSMPAAAVEGSPSASKAQLSAPPNPNGSLEAPPQDTEPLQTAGAVVVAASKASEADTADEADVPQQLHADRARSAGEASGDVAASITANAEAAKPEERVGHAIETAERPETADSENPVAESDDAEKQDLSKLRSEEAHMMGVTRPESSEKNAEDLPEDGDVEMTAVDDKPATGASEPPTQGVSEAPSGPAEIMREHRSTRDGFQQTAKPSDQDAPISIGTNDVKMQDVDMQDVQQGAGDAMATGIETAAPGNQEKQDIIEDGAAAETAKDYSSAKPEGSVEQEAFPVPGEQTGGENRDGVPQANTGEGGKSDSVVEASKGAAGAGPAANDTTVNPDEPTSTGGNQTYPSGAEQVPEEDVQPKEEDKDDEMETSPRKRARRSSVRAPVPPRTTRSRTTARVTSAFERATHPSPEDSYLHIVPKSVSDEAQAAGTGEAPPVDTGEEAGASTAEEPEETPRPRQTPQGLRMDVRDSVFVTIDQLPEVKRNRMRDKKLKPIEELTFADVRSYNRDQLRCYCYIYSTPRQKKVEMEADMARFVSLWNEGRPGFVLSEYVPNAPRGGLPIAAIHASPAAASGSGKNEVGNGELPVRTSRRSSSGANRSGLSATDTEGADGTRADEFDTLGNDTSRTPARSPEKLMSRRTPSRSASRTPSVTPGPHNSARRPPVRAPAAASIHHIAIQPNPRRDSSTERPLTMARTNAPGSIASAAASSSITLDPNGTAGGTGPSRGLSNGVARPSRSPIPTQPMPKGLGTSFKQKVHARTAGAKFKAAYNGAGPAIVNIVENAAAYFEGKDSPEVIRDRAKSYERYQFNVDLLSEVFDGAPPDPCLEQSGTDPSDANGGIEQNGRRSVLQDIAKRMRKRTSSEMAEEMRSMEENYRKLDSETKVAERSNMRMFQRLERAETEQEIDAVKQDFMKEHNVRFDDAPPPLVRRKLDKSLPPLVMPDNQCRILRFKL